MNFYSIKFQDEAKYYSNLKKLCIAHDLDYHKLYWHINRQKKGEWSNDFVIVTKHEML